MRLSSHRPRLRAAALLLCAAALAGCPSDPPAVDVPCEPACAAGFRCDTTEGLCLVDGDRDAAVPDAAVMTGTCKPACAAPTPQCNAKNQCVACLVDDHCDKGQYCKALGDGTTVCVPGCKDDARCPAGRSCCDGACIDGMSDLRHCGGCGKVCVGSNNTPQCVAGACKAGACRAGYGDCNADGADGCEAALRVDPANCGACGMACAFDHGVGACASECYLAACEFGYDDCNGDPMDGCETTVLTDPTNCGACGQRCPGLPNARSGCFNATCGIELCNAGFADCDGDPANGCEVAVATDAKNCGVCGNACPMGLVCKGGGCTCPNCNIPNASALCVNNQCVFDKCNPGWFDCNANQADGCEANIGGDPKNCGQCGNVCPNNLPACVNGVCGVQTCLNNAKWMRVSCTTMEWVWSRDRGKAMTVMGAAQARVLATGCRHAGDQQPQNGEGKCSLDGKGWVSTQTFQMQGCDGSWYHLGGRFSGNCGGHDGDTWRHLVLGDNDCWDY